MVVAGESLPLRQPPVPGLPIDVDVAGVLGRSLANFEPRLIHPLTNVWRASVALVLRCTRDVPSAPDQPLRDFLHTHARSLELLFIQRAVRQGDPWSGHIAFPGGRREDADEGDLGCAVRETQEELGLDLNDEGQFRLLGRLDDEAIPSSRVGRNGGVLSSFVFVQKPPAADWHDTVDQNANTPAMLLDVKEVAACLWVPMDCLLAGSSARTTHVHTIRPMQLGIIGRATPAPLLKLLGVLTIRYTAVDVIGACTEIVYAEGDHQVGEGSSNVCNISPEDEHIPVLWGMSLRAASDLVKVFGGSSHVANRPTFVFDNRILAFVHRGFHRVVCTLGRRLSFIGRLVGFRRRRK
jgi:8-oxo-dGTP pyrophosphatase MutT (NUDIX family)